MCLWGLLTCEIDVRLCTCRHLRGVEIYMQPQKSILQVGMVQIFDIRPRWTVMGRNVQLLGCVSARSCVWTSLSRRVFLRLECFLFSQHTWVMCPTHVPRHRPRPNMRSVKNPQKKLFLHHANATIFRGTFLKQRNRSWKFHRRINRFWASHGVCSSRRMQLRCQVCCAF